MATVSALPTDREALLGPASRKLEIGLIGARTATALRRVLSGAETDDADRSVLSEAEAMLRSVANAIDFVESGGSTRQQPASFGFGAMAFAMETTAANFPSKDLTAHLRQAADELASLQVAPNKAVAATLVNLFSGLADVATRHAGTVGEVTGTRV